VARSWVCRAGSPKRWPGWTLELMEGPVQEQAANDVVRVSPSRDPGIAVDNPRWISSGSASDRTGGPATRRALRRPLRRLRVRRHYGTHKGALRPRGPCTNDSASSYAAPERDPHTRHRSADATHVSAFWNEWAKTSGLEQAPRRREDCAWTSNGTPVTVRVAADRPEGDQCVRKRPRRAGSFATRLDSLRPGAGSCREPRCAGRVWPARADDRLYPGASAPVLRIDAPVDRGHPRPAAMLPDGGAKLPPGQEIANGGAGYEPRGSRRLLRLQVGRRSDRRARAQHLAWLHVWCHSVCPSAPIRCTNGGCAATAGRPLQTSALMWYWPAGSSTAGVSSQGTVGRSHATVAGPGGRSRIRRAGAAATAGAGTGSNGRARRRRRLFRHGVPHASSAGMAGAGGCEGGRLLPPSVRTQ